MPISQVARSNTFADWRNITNTIITQMNKLTESGNTFQSNTSLLLSGNGTVLVVNNAATFGTVNANTIQTITIISSNVLSNGISILTHANNAYAQANIANSRAWGAFAQANAAWEAANSSTAGTANTIALLAYDQANTANSRATGAFATANSGWGQANTAMTNANNAYAKANAANTLAQTAYTNGNNAYVTANTANTIAGLAYDQANTGNTRANGAFATANLAFVQANSAFTQGNTADSRAIGAFAKANAITMANVGTLGVPVFAGINGNTFQMRRINVATTSGATTQLSAQEVSGDIIITLTLATTSPVSK